MSKCKFGNCVVGVRADALTLGLPRYDPTIGACAVHYEYPGCDS